MRLCTRQEIGPTHHIEAAELIGKIVERMTRQVETRSRKFSIERFEQSPSRSFRQHELRCGKSASRATGEHVRLPRLAILRNPRAVLDEPLDILGDLGPVLL